MQPLPESEWDSWDEFVGRSANGRIFHTAWWHKAWGADITILARKAEDGSLEAGLPVHYSGFPGALGPFGVRGIRRPPLTPMNGPVFPECRKPGRCSRYSHVKKEIVAAMGSLPEIGFYDFSLGRDDEDAMPFMWNGFEVHVGYTYIVRQKDSEQWRKNMSEKARRALKGAHKEGAERGCTVHSGAKIEEVMGLYDITTRLKGFSMERYTRRIPAWWAEVEARGAGSNYVLRDRDGKPLCAAMLLWDGRASYAMMNGMLEELRRESHLNMLVFEKMIDDTLSMGLDFDFNGSMLIGVERFFRGWGGEMRQYYRAVKIPSAFAYTVWKSSQYMGQHRRKGWVEWKNL